MSVEHGLGEWSGLKRNVPSIHLFLYVKGVGQFVFIMHNIDTLIRTTILNWFPDGH
jgi:hypothetical protein